MSSVPLWLSAPAKFILLSAAFVIPNVPVDGAETQTAAVGVPREKAHPKEIPLWAEGAPDSVGRGSEPEELSWRTEPDIMFVVTSNIHEPSIVPYLPDPAKANGAAVIIAPGGGHMFLTMNREGYDFAEWLSERGFAAFVLKYRLARDRSNPVQSEQPYSIDKHAKADAIRAVQLIRSRAKEWKVDPAKIGFAGFSAGGEVALLATAKPNPTPAASGDPLSGIDGKPDFLAVLYPGGLRRSEIRETIGSFPPVFLLCAYDDRMPKDLSEFFTALKDANVNAELHIYNSGGHGFGVRERDFAVTRWPDRFVEWLRDRKFVN